MKLDQLNGKYQRLRQELADAYAEDIWDAAKIDRLAEDIAQTERAIAGDAARLQPNSGAVPC